MIYFLFNLITLSLLTKRLNTIFKKYLKNSKVNFSVCKVEKKNWSNFVLLMCCIRSVSATTFIFFSQTTVGTRKRQKKKTFGQENRPIRMRG